MTLHTNGRRGRCGRAARAAVHASPSYSLPPGRTIRKQDRDKVGQGGGATDKGRRRSGASAIGCARRLPDLDALPRGPSLGQLLGGARKEPAVRMGARQLLEGGVGGLEPRPRKRPPPFGQPPDRLGRNTARRTPWLPARAQIWPRDAQARRGSPKRPTCKEAFGCPAEKAIVAALGALPAASVSGEHRWSTPLSPKRAPVDGETQTDSRACAASALSRVRLEFFFVLVGLRLRL